MFRGCRTFYVGFSTYNVQCSVIRILDGFQWKLSQSMKTSKTKALIFLLFRIQSDMLLGLCFIVRTCRLVNVGLNTISQLKTFFKRKSRYSCSKGADLIEKLLLSFIAQIQNKPVPSCEKSVQWLVTAAMCCMWWQGVLIGLFTFVPL